MVGLGDLAGGGFLSAAYDASAGGSVVVGISESASGGEAFRWTAVGGMVGLGDLPGGDFYSGAWAASADGSVVVGLSQSASGAEAFRWTSAGGMVGLGDLPGGNFYSLAEDVSADGSVVVGSGSTIAGVEAFVWDAFYGMRNLKDVLETDFGLDLTGWTLVRAHSVSDDGLVIAGYGMNPDGATEAWIARLGARTEPTIADSCDVGGGPNDIETVTASYDAGTDEIVVVVVLCSDADDRTNYQVYFDHQDATNLDGDGIDDGPDTLDPNPDCVATFDERMVHKGRKDRGPGIIDVAANTLTYSVAVDDLNPSLELGDTVLIWADTKFKKVSDRAPNTESGDGCVKPEVASEVISLVLR